MDTDSRLNQSSLGLRSNARFTMAATIMMTTMTICVTNTSSALGLEKMRVEGVDVIEWVPLVLSPLLPMVSISTSSSSLGLTLWGCCIYKLFLQKYPINRFISLVCERVRNWVARYLFMNNKNLISECRTAFLVKLSLVTSDPDKISRFIFKFQSFMFARVVNGLRGWHISI